MTAFVIDTNVLAVANGKHAAADTDCVEHCISALMLSRDGTVLVDDGYRIFDEYRRYCSHRGQPGLGDAFFKWLWDNQANERHCIQVPIRHIGPEVTDFAEYPTDTALAGFDRGDRVFVAVAIGSELDPDLLNASDTDWWRVRHALARNGVRVQFLCENLMK
ncbi:MAG TPA: hypothetical protein VHX14_19270 [Thermoanaerobaculia bacterium]|jgi:hypothetical protein|nr:hypothetical protein [Thermoanaerobaculia bacterium]